MMFPTHERGGLLPPVRGAPPLAVRKPRAVGFGPVLTGSSRRPGASTATPSVHPRRGVRFEHRDRDARSDAVERIRGAATEWLRRHEGRRQRQNAARSRRRHWRCCCSSPSAAVPRPRLRRVSAVALDSRLGSRFLTASTRRLRVRVLLEGVHQPPAGPPQLAYVPRLHGLFQPLHGSLDHTRAGALSSAGQKARNPAWTHRSSSVLPATQPSIGAWRSLTQRWWSAVRCMLRGVRSSPRRSRRDSARPVSLRPDWSRLSKGGVFASLKSAA